ncbi:hypothetical protein OWR29_41690 [Actinoplanes sp. Pm04-4]|uniref:Uncharacterized protein n=1 Tax=Paractinoplanes pyxinae TaxID=2997416 RepID=A0ABT4BDF8_9ACTN|nr:hypothetical protein [Actinoplanes pyxinae]MCY1144551.1 hypothetical protein [Actinoplanes pyxinae]
MVMSLTLKIPNCMTAPSPPGLDASRLLTRTTTLTAELFQNLRKCAAARVTSPPTCALREVLVIGCDCCNGLWGVHVQILIKIMVTSIAGGLTYFLTNATDQPEIWQLTISIFVAGVVVIVQFLIESSEQSRKLVRAIGDDGSRDAQSLAEKIQGISEAATHLARVERLLGRDSVVRLVESVGRMDPKEEFLLRFAHRQLDGLTTLVEGLRSGRADHEGENPDWLLDLTDAATISIDATSMTSFDTTHNFVDEGDFWSSELGLRYLDRQRQAIERNVRIRRLFLLTDDATDAVRLKRLLEPHRKIDVEIKVLRHDDVPFLYRKDLEDFILFDQKVSYELQTARVLRSDVTPSINNVALVSNPILTEKRKKRFEDLWAAAHDPEVVASDADHVDSPPVAR